MTRAGAGGRPAGAAWSVLCDFDGTISPEDVTDSLLHRFARPGWEALEAEWQAGRIGSRACMAQQVALLDCDRAELDAHVAGIAIDPAFAAFVALVEGAGATLTIVSDGLDVVIDAILEREGLAHLRVRSSRLVQLGPRSWALEFPHGRDDCRSAGATCKCAGARVDAAQQVLLIGDGASDFCAASSADMSFARAGLLRHCADLDLPCRSVRDFGAAIAAWSDLVAPCAAADEALAAEDET